MTKQIEKIKRIKSEYEQDWLALPEVVSVGIGETSSGEIGLIVSVKKITARVKRSLPKSIAAVPVEVRKSGEIKAL